MLRAPQRAPDSGSTSQDQVSNSASPGAYYVSNQCADKEQSP